MRVERSLGSHKLLSGFVRQFGGLADRVRALAPEGVDAVYDTVGRGVLAASATRPGACLASIAEPGVPGSKGVFCRLDSADFAAVAAVAALAEAGDLSVRIGATFPLERAADAQRVFAADGVRGKVVVAID